MKLIQLKLRLLLLYAVVWCGGVTAGLLIRGWWWLIPATISAIAFFVIFYSMFWEK
jgi:hypothetical protein